MELEKRALAEFNQQQVPVSDEVQRYRLAAGRISAPNRLAVQAIQGVAREAGVAVQGFKVYREQTLAFTREFREAADQSILSAYDKTMMEFPRRAREVGIVAYLQEAENFHRGATGSNRTPLGLGTQATDRTGVGHQRKMSHSTFPF